MLVIGLIAVLAYFRPGESIAGGFVTAYPGPEELKMAREAQSDSTPNPYPIPTGDKTICEDAGKWLTYTNEDVGYTFKYPAESQTFETFSDDLPKQADYGIIWKK